MPCAGCQLVKEVRNTFLAHSARVTTLLPAFGDDRQRAAFLDHLVDAHLHAGMHRADEDVDLVALDQAVGVLRAVLGLGFVIELDELNLAAAELAAFLCQRASLRRR